MFGNQWVQVTNASQAAFDVSEFDAKSKMINEAKNSKGNLYSSSLYCRLSCKKEHFKKEIAKIVLKLL